MLASVVCPHCHGSASLLKVVSSICDTDIYQCETCAQVSERPKDVKEPVLLDMAGTFAGKGLPIGRPLSH